MFPHFEDFEFRGGKVGWIQRGLVGLKGWLGITSVSSKGRALVLLLAMALLAMKRRGAKTELEKVVGAASKILSTVLTKI